MLGDFAELRNGAGLDGLAEATARTWIERFLAIFGWNPADPRQVIQEYTIAGREARRLERVGTRHRRPDYALVYPDGRRILYIEAKRFDVKIEHDMNASYQLRLCGWCSGFLVSYVFDFEELAIYDCRVPPGADEEADVARVTYLRWTDYLENFDLLWDHFSREAILDGSLQRCHPEDQRPRGSQTLDERFEEDLSEWRRELAKTIRRHGKVRDPEILSAAAQRILDRIIFLRFCEDLDLEELGTLRDMAHADLGFWPAFMEMHETRYRRMYDGILFPLDERDDPTGIEGRMREWWLKGKVFERIIGRLYFPQPYLFDFIPIELLGGIYERYLGKKLVVVGADVKDTFKPEYQRTKGAVYTPSWIVQRVVHRTLGPLTEGLSPGQILDLRILDPACGSGSFLLGAFDHLERAILAWCAAHPEAGPRDEFVIAEAGGVRLRPSTARAIITRCLHGVDIDPEAVEIARMSLALRYVSGVARDLSTEHTELLAGIGRNVKHGNSLVGPDFVRRLKGGEELLREVMPFDWEADLLGFGQVMRDGGFHAVVGNPPYIEVKRYREWSPGLYRYLKDAGVYETAREGKTDISIPFMERGVKLLRPGGRLGFIIQNRFFKTDYGAAARRWLRKSKLIERVEDFSDLQVFPGRTTYTAIMVLRQGSPTIAYSTYADRPAAEGARPCLEAELRATDLDDNVWSFDQPDLLAVHRALAARHGTIADIPGVKISVGLQTLYGRFYQFLPLAVTRSTVRGRNADGEEVLLERKAMRPLCRNRGFFPFRRDNADAFVIFPYDVNDEGFSEIRWREFKDRFPRTAAYLDGHKRALKEAVEVPDGPDRWHLYLYPKNLVAQTRPKVLFPMTIEDTVAAVDEVGDVYQDNVNVNSLALPASREKLVAIAAIINSTTFSALGRLKAGLNDAGWRKFNRQYAELVPFPWKRLTDAASANLCGLADQIQKIQEQLRGTDSEGARQGLRMSLASLWDQLDADVDELYALRPDERAVIKHYPRKVDRVELVLRQTETAAGEESDDGAAT